MRRILKLVFILFISLSVINPSFINALTNAEVELPVELIGPNGTIEISPWSKEINNDDYRPGPALENNTIVLNNNSGVFNISIGEVGNFVYEIKQINKTNPNISYDIDAQEVDGNRDKIYRLFITVVYNDDQSELIAYTEAQSCDNYACVVDIPESNIDLDNKPGEICFENEVIYWVKYLDGDHGKSDGLGDETGKHLHDLHKGGNNVTPDSGYKFTGRYTYVITDLDGNVIGSGEISEQELLSVGIEILGNITLTPIYELLRTYPKWVQPITGIIAANPYLSIGIFISSMFILFAVIKKKKKQEN